MIFSLEIYILSILVLYIISFWKIIFPIKNHICVLLLNDAELRGGGGLITQSIEVCTFFGIPYKILKHSHDEIHQYSEWSFYPFKEYVTENLLFRDTNYSFFADDNFRRAEYFYKKNFPLRKTPKVWISVPYSFIEKIYLFPIGITIGNLKIYKNNLFRSLSHLVWDNELPANTRKFILLQLAFRWIFLLLIPGIIHYIFFIHLQFLKNRNIVIWKSNNKKIKKWIYIWLNENNLKGRKSNRYMKTDHEYIFHVHSVWEKKIEWNWKIIIRKTLPSSEHFPFVGKYNCTFDIESSSEFKILWWTHLCHKCDVQSEFFHEIPFTFKLPREWNFSILRQSCLQNTNIFVSIDTLPFCHLPSTNLTNKIDHWHYSDEMFNSDFTVKYEFISDTSPLRMIYRWILDEKIVQISFQKPIIPKQENFRFYFKENSIDIASIDVHDNGKILIFHLAEKISHYPHSERKDVLKVWISNLQDTSGMSHYNKTERILWFPWKE